MTMGRMILLAWAVFASVIACCTQARAAEPDWKVGLAQAKITPERPVFLAGYSSRNKPFEKVESDLFVKVLILEDRAGQRVALVTSDRTWAVVNQLFLFRGAANPGQ